MPHMEWIVGLVAVFLIFGGGHIVSEWLKGEQEIRRLKVQRAQGNVNGDTLRAIEDLRKEVAELRDTTTRFDMSFDAAITHLEQRMDRVEQRDGRSIANDDPGVITLNRG
jgi:hypothetical protein